MTVGSRRPSSPSSLLLLWACAAHLWACQETRAVRADPSRAAAGEELHAARPEATQPQSAAPAGAAAVDLDAAFRLADEVRNPRPPGLGWLDADHISIHGRPPDAAPDAPAGPYRVRADSGAWTPLYQPAELARALAGLDAMSAEEAAEIARRHPSSFLAGPGGFPAGLLIGHEDSLYAWRFGAGSVVRVAGPDAEGRPPENELPSPDGAAVAFVRGNDLHVAVLPPLAAAAGEPPGPVAATEVRLTHDGGPERLNGILDWVYQEEVYGRGDWRAFWWSPDSSRLAFLRLDEGAVREFRVEDHIPLYGKLETWRYPKAGESNPGVEVGCVAAAGGAVTWLDLAAWPPEDRLVVWVGWTPDSAEVVLQIANRIQTRLDLVLADPVTGAARSVIREEPGAWVQRSPVQWLRDGSFLWQSVRTGRNHLYRYRRDGALLGAITAGEFQVLEVALVDEDAGVVFAVTDEGNPLERHLWRIPLDLSPRTRVTSGRGTHSVEMAPGGRWYLDTWSNAEDPGATELRETASGRLVRELSRGAREKLLRAGFSPPEFHRVPTRDGFPMEARLVRPPDPRPAQGYPVLVSVYGGPESAVVRDAWGGRQETWLQALARAGYLIWSCDNRSASGKAYADAAVAYRRLGETELRDVEDGLDWLVARGLADPERIGIFGWSYGGYLAAYALTHSKHFKAGIAGAPVTDWRNYDTIYTERYMSTPQDNPDGYRTSSVVEAAGNLHGDLLLIHGTMDENVHLANTLQLAYALQEAGKPFWMMLYPRNRHGVGDPEQRRHLYELMTGFILARL